MNKTILPPARSLVIFGHRHQGGYLGGIEGMLRLLSEAGFSLRIEETFLRYLRAEGVALPAGSAEWRPVAERSDAAVSIGGDGTFLRAARRLGDSGVPLLGINTGHLGFLTQFTIDEASVMVSMLGAGGAGVEKRMVLRVECGGMPEDLWPFAINEVAIIKEETSSMISVSMEVDGLYLADYLADGVVVCTPTGSTAYNLSAGGPLLQPSLDCMAISPIAPHTLTLRPLVVSGDSRLHTVTSSRAARYRVSLDGNSFRLRCGESLDIARAPFGVPVVQRPDTDFADALRRKLLWGQR